MKEHLAGGRVVSTGGFRLDRRRAMEKLSRFQLEDPHRYVLELVAAAVRAGAEQIRVTSDADDFIIEWEGLHPTREELDALFDHLFHDPDRDRARFLNHLAHGVFGAHGLQPRWIHLERPGLTLDLTDPLEVSQSPNTRGAGVRVHVRERFSLAVLKEAVWFFDDAHEAALLRAGAPTCPSAILLNGREIERDLGALMGRPEGRATIELLGGRVWLSRPLEPTPRAPVDLFKGEILLSRDGVVADQRDLALGDLRLRGWARADGLRLNASRSHAVQDAAWKEVEARLRGAAVRLLVDELGEVIGRGEWPGELLRGAALQALIENPRQAAPLRSIPVLRDAAGRFYSVDELVAVSRILQLGPGVRADATVPAPQFKKSRSGLSLIDKRQQMLLRRHCGKTLKDGREVLRDLRAGRARRQKLARSATPMRFPAARGRAFDREGVRGFAGFGGAPVPAGQEDQAFLELRVEGLTVDTFSQKDVPGPLLIRLEADDLKASATFDAVVQDAAFKAALEVARAEAWALIWDAARARPMPPEVRPLLLETLRRKSRARKRKKHRKLHRALTEAPLFHTVEGLVSFQALAARKGALPYARREEGLLPEDAQTLMLDQETLGALKPHLGSRLKDLTPGLRADAEAARRRAQPPHPLVIRQALLRVYDFEAATLRGQIGASATETGSDCVVDLVHQGVLLGTFELEVGYPNTYAAVEWDDARPSRAWDGLANAAQRRDLAAALAPHLEAALLAQVQQLSTQRWGALPHWLVGPLMRHGVPPAGLAALPLFPAADGPPRSLADLLQGTGTVYYLKRRQSELPPSLARALIVDDARLKILRVRLPSRRLRDGADLLERRSTARRLFRKRPRADTHLRAARVAGRTPLQGEGLSGEVGLRDDPDAPAGLTVEVLHEHRLLTRRNLKYPVAMKAIVYGPRIIPSGGFEGLVAPMIRQAIRDLVAEALPRVFDAALRPPGPSGPLTAALLLALRAGALPLDKTRTSGALDFLTRRETWPLIGGGKASLASLRAHQERGELVTAAPRYSGVPAPTGKIWLMAPPWVQAALPGLLGATPPDRGAELESIRAGIERRQKLPTAALVPEDARGGAREGRIYKEEGTRLWIAVGEGRARRRLEWLVEGRSLVTETTDSAIPLRARVTDAEARADPSFTRLIADDAVKRARRRVDQSEEALAMWMARAGSPAVAVREPHRENTMGWSPDEREEALAMALRWASARRPDRPAWAAIPLLETSEGETVALPELLGLARKGPLRVVAPGTSGAPLNRSRPALRLPPALREALGRFAALKDFDEQLEQEEAQRQWTTQAIDPPRPPAGPQVLLSLDLDDGRSGHLQVHRDGGAQILVYSSWRPLGVLGVGGPVPFRGAVSDPALEPDARCQKPARGKALTALRKSLRQRSNAALAQVLERVDPARDRRLLLTMIGGAFNSSADVKRARGARSHLAKMKLFSDGEGVRYSAAELTRLPQPLRFVPVATAAAPLDPKRPFIELTEAEAELIRPALVGTWSREEAAREARVMTRRRASRRAFKLTGNFVARGSAEAGKMRAILGIRWSLDGEGVYDIRCSGVPVERRDAKNLPGLVAIIELPAGQIDEEWTRARLSPAQERAIRDAYVRAVPEVAERLRATPRQLHGVASLLRRIMTIEGTMPPAMKAWRAAPLFVGVDRTRSADDLLASAKEHGALLVGEAPLDEASPLVLKPEVNDHLIRALGLRGEVMRAAAWSARRASERDEAALEAARDALKTAAARHLGWLMAGLSGRDAIVGWAKQIPEIAPDAALADPDGPAAILCAWSYAESALILEGRLDDILELTARVGEALVRRRT